MDIQNLASTHAMDLARQMVRKLQDALLKAATSHLGREPTLPEVREHMRRVTRQGSSSETFFWDETPLLIAGPVELGSVRDALAGRDPLVVSHTQRIEFLVPV